MGSLVIPAVGGSVSLAAANSWTWTPWITAGVGYESDRVLDPDLDRNVVPGGAFLDLIPGLALNGPLGPGVELQLSAEAGLERFLNSSSRRVWDGLATATLFVRSGGSGRFRFAVEGTFHDDSEWSSVNRGEVGLRAGYGWTGRRWRLEGLAGLQRRGYPNVTAYDSAGDPLGTYREGNLDLALSGAYALSHRVTVEGFLSRRGTDARDDWYDAGAWSLQVSGRWRVAPRTRLTATLVGQNRTFTSRPDSVNGDRYGQAAAALGQDLSARVGLVARYAFARYTLPQGGAENIHRGSVEVVWRPGGGPGPRPPERVTTSVAAGVLTEGLPYRFRLRAPDAASVALVGDFNGWNPGAHPLRADGNGWWELETGLPAGTHQYAYLVDGTVIAPPEAAVTVDDGFGGQNGLLTVLPGER